MPLYAVYDANSAGPPKSGERGAGQIADERMRGQQRERGTTASSAVAAIWQRGLQLLAAEQPQAKVA